MFPELYQYLLLITFTPLRITTKDNDKIIKKRPMQNKENINNEMSLNIYFLIKLPPDSTLLLLKPDS